ncbi:hypothetical protein L6164_012367 [Bauhinia variegata]|uniref:Uncharacterized protein n=1 Tax=Bauhinia variegata TaxID=167791 RepID=A0ACB9P9S9_BAUVA|nr:hypothetical protein L6164_012367 [Bauhinia variegata]
MVTGDNFSDGYFKTRPVLADVTNRPAKRAISLISGDSAKQDADDGDTHLAKQVCLGVENLVEEKCKSRFGVDCNYTIMSMLKGKHASSPLPVGLGIKRSTQIVSSDDASLPNDQRLKCNLLDSSSHIVRDSTKHGMELGNAARDSCISSASTPTCSRSLTEISFGYGEKGSYHEDRHTCDSAARAFNEGLLNPACENDDRDLFVDKSAASKLGAIEGTAISSSEDYKFPGLERCVGLKGDGGANSMASGDLLKACSCSLCSKAAYIWSDLHYQDIKGRLAALKKSQKEASSLIQKFNGEKQALIHDKGNSNESSKLELYLTNHWRSLFGHMENTLAQESSQLESSFHTLKDLRESCKNDLEMIDKGRADNH